jgi:hypothetical protein
MPNVSVLHSVCERTIIFTYPYSGVKLSGALEECWAYNSAVLRSKPRSANSNFCFRKPRMTEPLNYSLWDIVISEANSFKYLGINLRSDLYSSPSIIRVIKSRRMRWAGHVTRMGEKRNAYRLLVGKPEGKRPLGRPRRRWVY